MRCWCGWGRRSRWGKFEKHLWDGQIGGRAMRGKGRNLGCLPCFWGLVFTVIMEKMSQILGKTLSSNLWHLWDSQMERSSEEWDLVCTSQDKQLSLSLSKFFSQSHPNPLARHFRTHEFQLQTHEYKLKTTVVPSHKLFLALIDNLLNQSVILAYIFSQLFLITCHSIGNLKIQTGSYIYVIFSFGRHWVYHFEAD